MRKFKKIIQGTFIQPELIANWIKDDYDKHFESYHKLRFDHIILQWSEYCEIETGKRFTYYPTNLSDKEIKADILTNLLEAGRKYDIKIYIGLGTNGKWWSNIKKSPEKFEEWFSEEAHNNILLLKDIWNTYSNADCKQAIAGWYIAFEPDNINFNGAKKRNIFIKYCERIVRAAHEYTKLPAAISPFFNRAFYIIFGPKKWERLIQDTVKGTGIDIIAVQDGIGCRREPIDDHDEERIKALGNVDRWFRASLRGIKKSGNTSELWADIETFTEKVEKGKSVFYPASIERIIKQIAIEEPFVKKVTSFSFQAYQDSDKNEGLFESYQKYVDDCKNERGRL